MGIQAECSPTLPENWQHGRQDVYGLTNGNREIVLGMNHYGRQDNLQVSVPDVGLLEWSNALDARACRSEIERNMGARPGNLLPHYARKSLNLHDQANRPTITVELALPLSTEANANLFRGTLRTVLDIRPEHADKIMTWRGDPRAVTLNGLMYYLKSAGYGEGDDIESPSKFVMDTCCSIVEGSVAQFMDDNNIPGLYYDEFGKIAVGHAANAKGGRSFLAPFENYASFVNVSNISAFLAGKTLPYHRSYLEDVIGSISNPTDNSKNKTTSPVIPEPPSIPAPEIVKTPEAQQNLAETDYLPKQPFNFLELLSENDLIKFECDAHVVGEDELLVVLRVTQDKETYEGEARGESSPDLFNEAATKLLLGASDLVKIDSKASRQNNIDFVKKLARQSPTYHYKEYNGLFECRAICKKDGVSHQISRLSLSKKSAQAQAARAMDRTLSIVIPKLGA